MISRTSPEIEVHLSYSIPEPNSEQSQTRYINPEALLTPDPYPINYIQNPEFQQQWQACPVQFSTTIKPIKTPPPQTEPQVETQMVTRARKRRMEEEKEEEAQKYKGKERFVG